ncbi:MAG TPA: DNA translocase FtsK [Candidatus Moranbacteria bacterium]|nr:DNA translocase FtsK [Candidatus Moranbacteria bacterium]
MSKEKEEEIGINRDIKKSIIAIVLLMIALIFLFSLFNQAGTVGEFIDRQLALMAGWGRYFLPLVMIAVGIMYFRKMEPARYLWASIGGAIFFLSVLGLFHIFNDPEQMKEIAKEGSGGGYLGLAVALSLFKLLGKILGVIILLGFTAIGFILIFNAPLWQFWELFREKLRLDKLAELREKRKVERLEKESEGEEKVEKKKTKAESKQEEIEENIKVDSIRFVDGPSAMKLDDEVEDDDLEDGATVKNTNSKSRKSSKKNIYSGSYWQQPPIDIFDKASSQRATSNVKENIEIITETLANFGIKVEPSEYYIGPTVTQYTFRPAVGVKLSRILSLQNDLALALAAPSIRIEAPIPGKSLVGVEVPNQEKTMVCMREVLESNVYQNRASNLAVVLGKNVNGEPVLANIQRMPHLLVAGATNTGKSVCINSILSTLLYANSPEELRMILVDPKRVELSLYNGVPHLLTPVIVDMTKVVRTLKWAVGEMERRYKVLQEAGVRDIQSYNQKLEEDPGSLGSDDPEGMPYILIVIDELADLMASHGKEVEGLIVRLAQMARAVGIHLILSTQRPSVEVITGLIKANIITRIALQVATQIDSRTILDMSGAEKLLGNGDMLYLSAESALPRRLQGIYISEKEVKRLVNALKKQSRRMDFEEDEDLSSSLEEQLEASGGIFSGESTGGEADDELYHQAQELVIQARKASTSMLQRRLSIGYSRAARIIDMLEENGIVGPQEGSKPRQVLVGDEIEEEEVGEEEVD